MIRRSLVSGTRPAGAAEPAPSKRHFSSRCSKLLCSVVGVVLFICVIVFSPSSPSSPPPVTSDLSNFSPNVNSSAEPELIQEPVHSKEISADFSAVDSAERVVDPINMYLLTPLEIQKKPQTLNAAPFQHPNQTLAERWQLPPLSNRVSPNLPAVISSGNDKCKLMKSGLYVMNRRLRVFVHFMPPKYADQYGGVDRLQQWGVSSQFATEYIIPKFFRTFSWPRSEIQQADVFIVPVYPKALRYANHPHKDPDKEKALETKTNRLYLDILKHVREKYPSIYSRRQLRDHVFVFPSGRGPTIFADWKSHISNSIFLSPEAGRTSTFKDEPAYFNKEKDIVIPGYVANFTTLRSTAKPMRERELLLMYCGDMLKSAQRENIGQLASRVHHRTDVLLKFNCSTSALASNAKFCLAPEGNSPWTSRFYQTLIAGCIPVLIGRKFHLPFPESIAWDRFVVRVPAGRPLTVSFIRFLAKFPVQELETRQRIIMVESLKVLYDNTAHMSAYQMIRDRLEDKYCRWVLRRPS